MPTQVACKGARELKLRWHKRDGRDVVLMTARAFRLHRALRRSAKVMALISRLLLAIDNDCCRNALTCAANTEMSYT